MRLEPNGPEACEPVSSGGFVQVKVPLRVIGGGEETMTIVRYRIDDFTGREVRWPLRPGSETRVPFRIPTEIFRDQAKLTLQVIEPHPNGDETTLWAKTYVVDWSTGTPSLEPLPQDSETGLGES